MSADLKARALRLLARREHSRAELARKLAPHAESDAALQAQLDQLEAGGQLSDERFAEDRSRRLARKYGVARICDDLRARGVARDLADRISATARMSELQRAKAVLARKYPSLAISGRELARQIRFLRGRGFSLATIREAIGESRERFDQADA